MTITDQSIISTLNDLGGSAYLSRLETSLAVRFAFSTDAEQQAALQSAFHRRVLIITPMGNVRTPPEEEILRSASTQPRLFAKNVD